MISVTNVSIIMSVLFISSTFIGCVGEPDIDSDNISDKNENCLDIFNPDQLDFDGDGIGAVSYTHLTLPTIYSV